MRENVRLARSDPWATRSVLPQDDSGIGAMIKKMIRKKAKSTAKRRKPAKRKAGKKQMDAAQVREEIAGMVKSEAKDITEAVIDLAIHGELAPAKYLFEVAGVFPPSTEPIEGTPREDSLAETLLHRLNIPIEPVNPNQGDDEPVELGEAKARDDGPLNSEGNSGKDRSGEASDEGGAEQENA